MSIIGWYNRLLFVNIIASVTADDNSEHWLVKIYYSLVVIFVKKLQ